ncbi:MAG: hypothetical protein ACI4RK_09015 [Oscillospiraceae bacterium]
MAEYIEREQAIKCAEKSYKMWNLTMAAAEGTREINKCYKMQELCKTIGEIFKIVPAADVAPVVHAHWKKSKEGVCGDYLFVCGACGADYWESPSFYKQAHYCPNCGAEMDEVENDG